MSFLGGAAVGGRVLLAATFVGVLFAFPGCTTDSHIEQARSTADELAQALSERKLAGVPIAGEGSAAQDAQAELTAILAGAANLPAKVTVDDVKADGHTATAALDWTWQTPGTPWTYQVPAQLEWAGEQWQVRWAPGLVAASLAPGETIRVRREQGRRGDILGAGEKSLVSYRKVVRYGIDKSAVTATEAKDSAVKLARLVGIDPGEYRKQVAKAGPKAFVPAIVYRAAAASVISEADLADIPGALAVKDEVPLAPTREFAAPILGRVGPATAELVKKSDGAIKAGDEVGLSGLEARYETQLGGTPGTTITAVPAAGTQASTDAAAAASSGTDAAAAASPATDGGDAAAQAAKPRVLFHTDPVPGQPLATTLDLDLQRAAEKQLANIAPASALVAVQPSTGNIVAAASGPGSKGLNTATAGQFPPGSTMKVVTALALLRAGVKPTDEVPCTARTVVDGKPFTNYNGYPASGLGQIPLATAVANSCNTAIISQRGKINSADLSDAAAALGLGVDHDLGFPAYFGQVPPAQSQTDEAAAMIGQGKVLASPLAMAAVAASVARGEVVVPRLLPEVASPSAAPSQPLTPAQARELRAIMRKVVTDGTARFLANLPGKPVGAKTGTAEFGSANPPQTHAWMIAYQGDLAVAVFVAEGESGSQTAGPVLAGFLRAAQ